MKKQEITDIYSEYADNQKEHLDLEAYYFYLLEVEGLDKYLTVNKNFSIDDEGMYL